MTVATSPYTVIYSFGDSLSDAGDAFLLTNSLVGRLFGLMPEPVSPPYYAATYTGAGGVAFTADEFSNGPVWVQDLAGLLGLATPGPGEIGFGTSTGYQTIAAGAAGGTDFAIGGSVTGPTGENTGTSVAFTSLSPQIANFEHAVPAPSATALYTVWSGSNDLLDLLQDPDLPTLYATGLAAQDVTQSVNNEIAAIQRLVTDGARSILVLNVPDLGIVPEVTILGADAIAAASAFARSFNDQLATALATAQAAAQFGTAAIFQEDVFGLIDAAVGDPAAYGLTNVTDPVYTGSFTTDDPPPTITGAAQNSYLFFDMLHPTATGHAAIAADALNTLGLACYVRGTSIETISGGVPVEELRVGSLVVTQSGRARPVRWIGHRSYGGRFLAGNPGAQPVRFRRGALGGGLPRRDLLVSPEHAMFIDGVLVPARALVNGTTIVREAGLSSVTYLHVELDSHDVLLAEGAPSESYLDDGSRAIFQNASDHDAGHCGMDDPKTFCAPRIESGARLAAILRSLDTVAVLAA